MARPHNLPDELLATQALNERLFHESTFDGIERGYCFLRQRNNGLYSLKVRGYEPETPLVALSQLILDNLNRRVNMGGAWVVAWVIDGEKLVCTWIDGDGDPQFTWEADRGMIINEIPHRRLEIDDICNQCFQSWSLWHRSMIQLLDPKLGRDSYRRALGEKPPSAT